jgi:hypothetical protein
MLNKTYAGIWIDHKKAVLSIHSNELEKTIALHSGLNRWSKSTGGSRGALPYTYNGGGASGKKDHKRENLLHQYYARILKKLGGIDQIYVMGPGLAKKEMKKVLEASRMGDKVKGIANKDYLTDNQIAAATRRFFKLETSK